VNIDLIGVPIDFGAGRRGVDMGPGALRYAGLQGAIEDIGHHVHDRGNVPVPALENCSVADPKLRYLDCILSVALNVAAEVEASLARGSLPLTLGGDHSFSFGSIGGAARVKSLGVIWIDAHGDFNTPDTTPSGNIHGMPLAALCGYGDARLVRVGRTESRSVNPANVVNVGARDLDPQERELMRSAGMTVLAMEQVDRIGMYKAMQRAIEIAARDTDGLYLSLDLDAVDPVYAPGVGTPVPGGLTYREALLACELVAESGKLLAMDLVEVNPILDERNRTAALGVELALSALGKRVWKDDPVDGG
jgi:arginase